MLQGNSSTTFAQSWPIMEPTVLSLLRQQNVSHDQWHDLFLHVHKVCLWDPNGAPSLRSKLEEEISKFISQAQQRVVQNSEDSALLKAYISEWTKFFEQCVYLPQPFNQLEVSLSGKSGSNASHHTSRKTQEDSIVKKLMLDTWNKTIFNDIKERLQNSAMKLVHSERNGEAFDSQLVIGVRESYVNLCSEADDKLKIYREHFEKAYIEATEAFYSNKAPAYLDENGVQNYMIYAEEKLKEEEKRGNRYLETRQESTSMQTLRETCVDILVKKFREQILVECPNMINQNETKKLELMFKLMDRVGPDGVDPMLESLEKHIFEAGIADMMAAAKTITTDSEKYVERLLDLFNRFSTLVKEAFNDDARFMTSRDKAYRRVVNDLSIFSLDLPVKSSGTNVRCQPESKCPELLANYCDMLLRKTNISKRLTSDDIDAKLASVILVLKYVSNKDVFMKYHKAHLTRRLILGTSADDDKEERMVEQLREVGMPADYVNKLQRMFQDIKVSDDLNQRFKLDARNNNEPTADSLNIKILNDGAWSRASDKVTVSLPVELEDYIPKVEAFYKRMHTGRKLQWQHLYSNGTLTLTNEVGKVELEVTTFQMAVLLSWNQRPKDRISYEALRLSTQLPDSELRRTVWSLIAFPKMKKQVLLCEPEIKKHQEIDDSTVFWVNQQFCIVTKGNRVLQKGKVNLIGRLQLSTEKSKNEDNEGIVRLRELRVQEAIVKIMKMRKTVTNAALQTELVDILRNMFQPSRKMIKEMIEWLIEHKYMMRDENDINSFVYLA